MQGLLQDPNKAQANTEAQALPEDPAATDVEADDSGADENNPAFVTAVTYVKKALYETGAADDVNVAMEKSQNPVEDVAHIAYEMTSTADEKTNGEVPDELLMLLAATVLEEIITIAEASGVEFQPAQISESLKLMLLRYLGEMGHDTSELDSALSQINPEQMNQLAQEIQ